MLKDPMEPRVDITLRVSIKGNGIELRTRDDYRPQPLELNGGVPLVLTGPDLESYLNPANLTFSGISKNEFVKTGKLPEGVYQFTVEALSYDRPGVVLSNSGMTIGWLVLNDPPHWTLPMQNSLLTATYPQFVNFSWMPMNTGSPNAAFTTEYEFTMVELWPEDRSPGDAINSFAPLFQTVTNNTSLVYGPAEPELTPGRKYVCRLRAYDTEGRDLFKNNGYSEILVFTFGQACLPPNTFTDKIISPEEARVEWTALPGHTQFNLSYSEQNPDGTWSNWYHNEGIMPYSNLKELKPERKYRYQLKAICGTIESEYSEIKEFATPAADTTEIVCGKGAGVPDIDDSPPLPTLHIGDRIDAGGFTALVTEAEGSNGNFTGKCILFVKTFGYAPIYSEFSGIGVNQSMQLTSGSIKSVKGELKIHSVDSIISDLNDMLGSDDVADGGNGNPNVGDPYQPGDTVTVTLGGEDFIITGDTTIITASGDTITTDFSQVPPIIVVNGDSTDVTTDELDFDNPGGGSDGTSDVASNVSDTAAYAITLVKFRPAKDQFFGFDKYPEDISQFQPDYSKEKVNKKDYPVHWKSTQSPGMSDKVVMEITAGVPDSIRTRLSIESSISGPLNYNFNANDSIWEVIVTGKSHQDEDHIIAWYTQDDGSRIAVGHLNLVSYNKQNMKLVIVPVNKDYSVEANALKDSLDNIYKGAITFWDVSVLTEPLEVEFEDNDKEGLDTDLPDMAAYTREMKNIRKAMKKRDDHDPNAQYLFLVAKSEKGNKNGIMPFRRRYGFIFMEDDGKLINNKEKLYHTAAHELGHGPFGLRHPWDENGPGQGSTYNLMDYTNKKPNNLLRKYQWHYIHNPKASLLGGDEEDVSEVVGTYYDGFFFYPDGEFLGHTGGDKTLVINKSVPKDLAKAYVQSRDRARIYNTVLTKVKDKNVITNVLKKIFEMEIKSYLEKFEVDDTKERDVPGGIPGGSSSGYGKIKAYVYKMYHSEYFYDSYYNTVNLLYHENLHSLDDNKDLIWNKLRNEEQYIRHYEILQSQTEHPSYINTTENFKDWCINGLARKNYLDLLSEYIATQIRVNPERYKNDYYIKSLIRKYDSFVDDANRRFDNSFEKFDWEKYYKDMINYKNKGECTLRIEDSFEGVITECGFNKTLGRFAVKVNGDNLMNIFPRQIIPNLEEKFKKGDYVIKQNGNSYYTVYKNNDRSQKIIIKFDCSDWDSMNN